MDNLPRLAAPHAGRGRPANAPHAGRLHGAVRTRRTHGAPPAGGFTLIELLVVMGIIVLLIAVALPAFNFMTGSRSVESATNQLSAVLATARAEAVGLQQPRGLVVFHDNDTDRSIAALVDVRYAPFAAWDATASSTNVVSYQYGDYRTLNAGAANASTYVCVQTHTESDTTLKPGTSGATGYWQLLASLNPNSGSGSTNGDTSPVLELRPGTDFLTLAKGVGVQSIGNSTYVPEAINPTDKGTLYRYSTVAVVLFDGNGSVMTLPDFDSSQLSYTSTNPPRSQFRILTDGLLGTRANLAYLAQRQPAGPLGAAQQQFPISHARDISPFIYGRGGIATGDKKEVSNYANPYRATVGLGLVVYNAEEFRNATAAFDADADAGTGRTFDWLDQNATPVLVNRFNGTLVKGE